MSNHKRKRPKNRRAGCLMCKPYKMNGFGKNRSDRERFSDHKRRLQAQQEIEKANNTLIGNQVSILTPGYIDEDAEWILFVI